MGHAAARRFSGSRDGDKLIGFEEIGQGGGLDVFAKPFVRWSYGAEEAFLRVVNT